MNPVTLYLAVGPDIKLLEANLDYYTHLGVSRILLSVHLRDQWADGFLDSIAKIIKNYPARIAQIHRGAVIEKRQRYNTVRSEYCEKTDWVIIADLDEFHEFSMPVTDVISLCESKGYDYVTGLFLDRVGIDGELTEYNGNIWDCFPVGAQLTRSVIHRHVEKVVLARACIDLAEGHHFAHEGLCCPSEECSAIVHHFKWDASVLERADHMYAILSAAGKSWSVESLRLKDYFNSNEGRVCLDDTSLEAYWPGYMRSRSTGATGLDGIGKDPNFIKPARCAIESISRPDDSQWRVQLANGKVKYLNSTSAMIMDLCDGKRTVREISSLLKAGFPRNWQRIEKAVQDALNSLYCEGMLTFQGSKF